MTLEITLKGMACGAALGLALTACGRADAHTDSSEAGDGCGAEMVGVLSDLEGWYPSIHGAGDTIGAANYLSADGAKDAAKLVKTGKVYSLAVVTGPDTPAFGERFYDIDVAEVDAGGSTLTTFNDDFLQSWLGIGTQIDGLGHLGVDHRYYNGLLQDDILVDGMLSPVGIESVPPIVARGVLIDMAKHFGYEVLPAGFVFNSCDIIAAAEEQKVQYGVGDVVIFHTGWLGLLDDPSPENVATYLEAEPGIGVDGAEYLASLGVVAVGADNWALEALPGEEGRGVFEPHQTLLAKWGVYILENIVTQELVADGVTEFMFVLGQPRLEGAAQTIVHPVAIH